MHAVLRGTRIHRIRLAAGLVLFTFAFFHFLNHALGLWSPEAMQAFRAWRVAVTRSDVGGIVLLTALTLHVLLGLYRLSRRSTWRMPFWEAVQILLGLSIPFLLFPHIVNTRIAYTFFGVNDSYYYELVRLWPGSALDQSVLLLLVWIHGCMGLHYWLRLSETYRRVAPVLLVLASLLPVAALAGFMVGGRAMNAAVDDPGYFASLKYAASWPTAAEGDRLAELRSWARWGFGALLALTLSIPLLRAGIRWMRGVLPVRYVGLRTVRTHPGPTLLEISRMNHIPHVSVCGGRARCSTCRVRVVEGLSTLSPPSPGERLTLSSVDAGPDVRLACQIRPRQGLTIARLLMPRVEQRPALAVAPLDAAGVEREIVILFLDIRGFTSMTENRLPYDVVFILNRFFAEVGAAIEACGGRIDKYMGDGLLAIFGEAGSPEDGCRQALDAAHRIDVALDRVNHEIADLVSLPLRIGMGVHVGPLVLGLIGHGKSASSTVIGETVNVASRLEALCKELKCQLIVSLAVAERAGLPDGGLRTHLADIRGLKEPLTVIVIQEGRSLATLLKAVAAAR